MSFVKYNFVFVQQWCLFLFYLPSFAQPSHLPSTPQMECQDGDVILHSVERGLVIMTCRFGRFDFLSSQTVRGFLESHRNDATFVARMRVLTGCAFEECLNVADVYPKVIFYGSSNDPRSIRLLNYFMDKLRDWLPANQ